MDQDDILDSLDRKLTRFSDGLLVSHLYNCLIEARLILEEMLKSYCLVFGALVYSTSGSCVLSLS